MASCRSANHKVKLIIGLSAVVVIAVVALGLYFAGGFGEEPASKQVETIPHRIHLRNFLADTALTFIPATKNDFAYYTLHTADRRLAGFVFLGTEVG
ncbi:hypothetical protein LM592_01380 [Candidatus Acetothermia bacterium]|nr:hypothetical protein [Candidatus Acetothermia bacterium]